LAVPPSTSGATELKGDGGAVVCAAEGDACACCGDVRVFCVMFCVVAERRYRPFLLGMGAVTVWQLGLYAFQMDWQARVLKG